MLLSLKFKNLPPNNSDISNYLVVSCLFTLCLIRNVKNSVWFEGELSDLTISTRCSDFTKPHSHSLFAVFGFIKSD